MVLKQSKQEEKKIRIASGGPTAGQNQIVQPGISRGGGGSQSQSQLPQVGQNDQNDGSQSKGSRFPNYFKNGQPG